MKNLTPNPFPGKEGGREDGTGPSLESPTHPPRGVVRGQRIEPGKWVRARELRRDMTPEEAILWERLRRNQLNGLHFRRQQVFAGFIIDFYCDAAALAIELDGGIHGEQMEYDQQRDAVLTGKGIRVLRIPNESVRSNMAIVLREILDNAFPSSSPPPPSQGGGRG